MGKKCSKCDETNNESAIFCSRCGQNLTVVVVPTGIQLISYYFLYVVAQDIVTVLLRYKVIPQIAEGFISMPIIWAMQIIYICAGTYVGFYLKKLKRTALYVSYFLFIWGMISACLMLANVNPILQRVYIVMDATPKIAEQDITEMTTIFVLLATIPLNAVVAGYLFKRRELFIKQVVL